MNIGLTGGIATGKSTVSSMLTMKGALLVDADLIAREVMLPGHPVLGKVTEHFGQAILFEDGTLNRKKLGEMIFHHPEQRTLLNEITHPAIRQEIRERTEAYERQYPDRLVVADIPLLLEAREQYSYLDQIAVVYVPRELQLERLMVRDDLNREAAEARLNSQMDIEEKKRLADILIDNSGTLAETQQQVDNLWGRLVRL
jgi:dephospho-CoA kinase